MIARRYPGALPFNSKQQNIFYGRDRDIEKLLTLISVEKQVLLYSKSGLGKTSLLEAGVIPELPKNFVPLSVRFYAYTKDGLSPVDRVFNVINKTVNDLDKLHDNVLDRLIDDNQEYKTLWYYFKKLQITEEIINEEQKPKVYLLIFDQFEELFTYPNEQIEEFKTQFYELTRNNVPDDISRLIAVKRKEDQSFLDRETIALFHQRNDVKTVFAIRSDRLSMLNSLTDKISDIQANFYEITPLDKNQARSAIVKPAMDPSKDFKTQAFQFQPEAVDKIINELTEDGANLETTQLQIVCQRIEEIATQKQDNNPGNGPVQINVEDLPEFKNIFLNFYEDSINKIPDQQKDAAKRLLEDELIRSRQRLSLDENICKEYVDSKTLEILVGTHLLRAERNTFQRFSYELSHDTLVEPILESQKKYQDEQAALKAEEERKEELRIYKEKQARKAAVRLQKIKRQRVFIWFGVVVSVIIVVALGFAVQKGIEANNALNTLRDTTYAKSWQEGFNFMEEAKYKLAGQKFQNAYKIYPSDSAKMYWEKCVELKNSKGQYDSIITQAGHYVEKMEFILAMQQYNKAILETGYNKKDTRDNKKKELWEDALKIYENDSADYKAWGNESLLDTARVKINILKKYYYLHQKD